ncbi:GyrI-like domain-containing protein [Leifsonia sp. fls2-241-R2A-40a]|uniref:GyrI-like domain-containing protein n=1 Tax=Leifsonia sp. fls2-241-R2A-40a TaxID=3040290 RepID=UPI002551888C|nr:GyrI-like domain-containing protein [Leifsonia sp. fls2-241-R2A-40a]
MEVVDGPRVEYRDSHPTLGIRARTPFRGMLAERDRLLAALIAWLQANGVEPEGPFFMRLHTVDMAGDMDIEVGAFANATGDSTVTEGVMPAGTYVVLRYINHSLRAHGLLFEWADNRDIRFDSAETDAGASWAARFEIWVTDPRTEPRKTRWETELAFLTR